MLKQLSILVCLLLCSSFILLACEPLAELPDLPTPVMNTDVPIAENTPENTPTALPPQLPLAAKVNGSGILLSDYERELQAYQASFSEQDIKPSDEEMRQTVLDFLIEQQLLANAAQQSGFTLSDQALDERIASLTNDIGGSEALNTWMQSQFHTPESLRASLRLATEAAHQRDLIINQVPHTAEQVRARQIFTIHQGDAMDAERSLTGGMDFEQLAWNYSPESGGELGWFPRDFLLFPEIEKAAFSLPVGSRSEIIQTELGYHILYIIAHEADHPLTTDARVILQNKALSDWLSQAKENATIEILIP